MSPGCANCYAETLSKRRASGQSLWGEDHEFRMMAESTWRLPERWNRESASMGRTRFGGSSSERIRVFCASMADVFEERPEIAIPRLRLLSLIIDTPHLDWLLLTKRPEFARAFFRSTFPPRKPFAVRYETPLPQNLWLGVSIENSRFTWRADVLRDIPAAVRFISAEPLLGSLFKDRPVSRDTRQGQSDVGAQSGAGAARRRAPLDLTGIDWVIVGGESGPGARLMDVGWARELLDACTTVDYLGPDSNDIDGEKWGRVGPAFHFKQSGAVLGKA